MINSIFFKQKKPLTVLILGVLIFLFVVYLILNNSGPLNQRVILSILSVLLIGYSVSFEIRKDFGNYKHIKMFGITVFKSKLNIPYPEYLIVFSAKYKQGAEWGSVAAMGKQRGGDNFVIRCFTGNKHFTLFRTKSLEVAKERATGLSNFLGIEIRGKN